MRSKETICSGLYVGRNSFLRVVRETSGDYSTVWTVQIGSVDSYYEVVCENKKDALRRYSKVLDEGY